MKRKRIAVLFLCLLLTGCSFGGEEPEQVYLASAAGFDADPSGGVILSVEVPLTRENEADRMEVCVFAGKGTTPDEAMEDLLCGLDKNLLFGHCAVLVLGDGLNAGQRAAIFSFAEKTIRLPLFAVVISAPDASALLSRGSLTASAAGYEIPDTLRLRSGGIGEGLTCRFYEVLSDPDSLTLPRFLPSDEFHAEADRLVGVRHIGPGTGEENE